MAIDSILFIGAVILACGCAGLLMVRVHNPRLLGLGWLGAALAAGGTGALLLLLDNRQSPLLAIFLADLLVLASLSLLNLAVMEVVGMRGIPRFSLLLLSLQAAAGLIEIDNRASGHFRVIVVGLLIAAQATQTVIILVRHGDKSIRLPARFISIILICFITWNFLRSLATASGLLAHRTLAGHALSSQIQMFTFILYLAVALGIAFGFFWMTTTGLTAKLEDLASTDPLTGVLNRRAFLRHLEDEFSRSERFSDSFALLMLDIDHFKQVNDRHGHHAGDEVLCGAAQNIQDAIRGIDHIGRWGGEEFAILLPRANSAAAQIVAQRIRLNIQRAAPLGDPSKHIPITASIGLAVRRPHDSVADILRRADAALYRAKAAGRDRVQG
jgi:diguanylate cyclase (GGDEF)-like protein